MGLQIIYHGADFEANSIGRLMSGEDTGFFGANMLNDGTFEQKEKPYRYVVSTFKREVAASSQVSITVTNSFPSHKLLIKVFEYDTSETFVQRTYDADYASRSATFTYTFTTSATTKYIVIGFEAVESPSGVSGPSLQNAVDTYTSMSISGTSDNLFEPDTFTLYGVDAGYYGANMASNGTFEKKTTKSYKYLVSTLKRYVAGSSSISIKVTNAYTNHQIMLKVFEYGETWNFIQRTYDADYASRSTTFTYTFTPTANTQYICIGFEAVAASGVAAPTVDNANNTYSSIEITGTDMVQVDPTNFVMYT